MILIYKVINKRNRTIIIVIGILVIIAIRNIPIIKELSNILLPTISN